MASHLVWVGQFLLIRGKRRNEIRGVESGVLNSGIFKNWKQHFQITIEGLLVFWKSSSKHLNWCFPGIATATNPWENFGNGKSTQNQLFIPFQTKELLLSGVYQLEIWEKLRQSVERKISIYWNSVARRSGVTFTRSPAWWKHFLHWIFQIVMRPLCH